MGDIADRLSQPDVASLPDWEAANVLNSPDPGAPAIVEWEPTKIGIGEIMATLGAVPGAALLSTIEGEAVTNSVMKWGLEILRSGAFDLSSAVAREIIDWLVEAGTLTPKQRDKLFALSRRERHPSWAEVNGVIVDARAVGLARGAKP